MQANHTKLQPLIEGSRQYLVPLFQRPYSWDKAQWRVLWNDIDDLTTEETRKTHFMGAIVTMPAQAVPEGITKYSLIDGQQRLTTILILMIALRDRTKEISGNLSAKIHEHFLTNKFNEDEDFFKLLPTQLDRDSFVSLIQQTHSPSKNRINEAYSFFAKKLVDATKDQLEKLFNTVTTRLVFVSIVLEGDDDAYLIFEGLNAKGLPLTQADLIRNYLLMRIHRKRQDAVYNAYWVPMQTAFGDNLTEFMRHFLMRNASFVKQNEVYATMKGGTDNYREKETTAYLEKLHKFSSYYLKLIKPETETNPNLQKRLEALRRLDVTTAYPFLLDLFDDLASQKCSEAQFTEILKLLETFLVRRFVCSVPTHDLNKFFPTVLAQAKQNQSLVAGVAEILAKRSFPRNAEFRRNLFHTKMYGGAERAAKTKLILERLEESYGHKEEVQAEPLTIEHIMPQTLTDWWKSHLGDNWEQVHERYVHTIGNLTLTGYNPNLSNSSFEDKKKIYAGSHLEITKSINGAQWTENEINERIEQLSERAIAVWPYFGEATDEIEEADDDLAAQPENDGSEAVLKAEDALAILGGGEPINQSKYYFRLSDGKSILLSVSRKYTRGKPYWYGISPAGLKSLDSNNCSHVAFGMGPSKLALLPVDIVKDYVKHCNGTRNKTTNVVRHFHFFITNSEAHELYGAQDSPRIPLKEYIREL